MPTLGETEIGVGGTGPCPELVAMVKSVWSATKPNLGSLIPNLDGNDILTNVPFGTLVLGVNRTLAIAGSVLMDQEMPLLRSGSEGTIFEDTV